jgi:DNA-binding CsgD family transcriptional regulator
MASTTAEQDAALAAAIAGAEQIPEVGAACRRIAEALGFPLFQFGFRVPVSFTRPCQIILSGYPLAWRTRYDDCGYLRIDPVVRRALSTVLPFAWDELALDTPEARQLFAEAAAHGLRHGFSAPVHGAHGEGALFSFARETPLPADAAYRGPLFLRAQWFTAQIHERLRALIYQGGNEFGEARPLTLRERECLQRAADGMSAAVIGRALRISEHTVAFHLANAEDKLGARSRQHAVARAVALGEIEPGCYPASLRQSQEVVDLVQH